MSLLLLFSGKAASPAATTLPGDGEPAGYRRHRRHRRRVEEEDALLTALLLDIQ